MPIFSKAGKRVLFVHIPRTGGLSIDRWMRNSGYARSKVDPSDGVNFRHAARDVYSTWGEFDYAFSVVREPLERFVSALRYRKISKRNADAEAQENLVALMLDKTYFHNHLRPQLDFLAPGVVVFRFEDDFRPTLGEMLELEGKCPCANKSTAGIGVDDLSEGIQRQIMDVYSADYAALGY